MDDTLLVDGFIPATFRSGALGSGIYGLSVMKYSSRPSMLIFTVYL